MPERPKNRIKKRAYKLVDGEDESSQLAENFNHRIKSSVAL